jgi:quercetin dioxygenase-like cupin family protein
MPFKRVAEHINVAPLLKKLERHPQLWGEITARQEAPGSPHKDTEAIFLRWCRDTADAWSVFNDLEAVDYPAAQVLMPEAGHALLALLTMLGETAELGRVMIVRLKPGGHITPHVDEGRYADFYDRFHICLSGECDFTVAGKTFTCRPGEGWWFNHKRKHEVRNASGADRLHMIVDVAVPAYRALRGVYFQREFSHHLWSEITPLLEKHWQEIAHYKDVPLDIDVERYNAMEEQGLLRCFTARDCGRLIGYAIFICGPNLHYKSTRIANQDVLFIAPEARNGTTAMRFFDFFEKRLASEGWQLMLQHEKIAHPALGRLCEKRGYEPMDRVWIKKL